MLSKAKLWLSLAVGTLLMWSTGAHAAWELNMPRGVTQISRDTYDLHMTIFWWMIAIGVVVLIIANPREPNRPLSTKAQKWK